MNQLSIPIKVSIEEVERKASLGKALEMCAEVAGFQLDKELTTRMGVDKAQFSRWCNGTEGIVWPKFCALMDTCGNDVPLLWMLHQRGYDLESLRKRESETERKLREAEAIIKDLRQEREIERRLIRDLRVAA